MSTKDKPFGSVRSHGDLWTIHMDADLTRLFNEGKSIKDLAPLFGRTEVAIRCRLQLLGFDPTREPALTQEEVESMSKAPNRYLVLGIKLGHVRRLASRRGYNPDEAIVQAIRADDLHTGRFEGPSDCLILVSIRDASDDVGAPLNTDVEVIEREPPVPPYRLVSLSRQSC